MWTALTSTNGLRVMAVKMEAIEFSPIRTTRQMLTALRGKPENALCIILVI